jgi:hypothetical protein
LPVRAPKKFVAVKAVPVTEEEKTKYPIPGKKDKYYEWRMDMTTLQMFPERDFIEALVYNDSTKISYNNFLKEILDSTITTKSQYKKYVEIGYLFYSKNMMDKLK